MRLRLLLALLVPAALAAPGPAHAAGPGDTLLASGLPGLAAPAPADFEFNASGVDFGSDGQSRADITASGARVAFTSQADGFVATAEERRYENLFVKDRPSGALIAVNPGANGSARWPSISRDGTKVAFETTATNLIPSDSTPDADVLVKDLVTGAYTLITSPGNDGCQRLCAFPELSGNGLFVAFTTSLALDPVLDTNTRRDVYRRPAAGGAAVLMSRDAAGADQEARGASISDDGNRVAFGTSASNLGSVADTNGDVDIYVRIVSPANTRLASAINGTNTAGNNDADAGRISGDGLYVTFSSEATDYLGAGGDIGGFSDVFRRTLGTTTTTLVSRSSGGAQANGRSYFPEISDDGNVIAFVSQATNLGGADRETYVRRVSTGSTATLGAGPSARLQSLTDDGAQRLVTGGAFTPALEPGLSVITAGAASREIVSRKTGGVPLVPRLGEADFDGGPDVSADGRYVAFAAASPGLPGGRDDGKFQTYRRDLQTGEVLLVSRATGSTTGALSGGRDPSISADGTRVSFLTRDAFDPADATGTLDAYVHDVASGQTTLASRATGATGAPANDATIAIDLSGDGRRVAFVSRATNLGHPSGEHVYVRDLATGTTTVVDRADGAAGALANGGVAGFEVSVSISGDGRRVAFATEATNLGDGDALGDVYVRDIAAATPPRVSRASGPAGAKGDDDSEAPIISADGNTVAFETNAENFGTGSYTYRQVAVRNLATAMTTVVSRGPGAGAPFGNASAREPTLSADGALVAYSSKSPNLGDPSGEDAVYVRRVATGEQRSVGVTARPDPSQNNEAAGVTEPALSADGRCLAFSAYGTGLVPGVSPDFYQAYLRVLEGDCGTTAPAPAAPAAAAPGAPATSPPRLTGIPNPVTPRITGLTLSRATFKVSPKATATAAAAKAGTTLRYRLSVRATTTIAVQRRTSGRRVGSSCRKATRKLRTRKACVRWVTAGKLTRAGQAAGARSVAFTGRVGRKALAPARYRFALTATAAGRRSPTVTKAFRVVRR